MFQSGRERIWDGDANECHQYLLQLLKEQKNMFNIKNQVFAVVVASLLIAAPVLAADNVTADGADGGRTVASKRLDCAGGACQRGGKSSFSDSQLEKMSAIRNQFMDKTGQERSEFGSLHRQLRDVLSQSSIDRSKAEGIQSKINSIKGELSTAKLDLKMDEIAVLTPEQREQLHHRMLASEAMGGGHFSHHRHSGGRHSHHGGGSKETGRQEKA